MFAVIFEVQPKPERWEDYLALAKQLKHTLEAVDGFIDNERFKSRRDDRRVLSLSIWRNEKAVVRWRTNGAHHGVQETGRFDVFEDYHLRVGEIVLDSDLPSRSRVGQERFDETEVGRAVALTITEVVAADDGDGGVKPEMSASSFGLDGGLDGLIDQEMFASIYHPGKLALLASWRHADAAASWRPTRPDAAKSLRHRQVRVIRDYGMFDRREAPQFYPDVEPRPGSTAGSDKAVKTGNASS
jgi:heme-degrading monooxygenase HmoA